MFISYLLSILIAISETKASVTRITLNDGKCHCFCKIGNFLLFNMEAFLQFFKPHNSASSDGKNLNCYVHQVENVQL